MRRTTDPTHGLVSQLCDDSCMTVVDCHRVVDSSYRRVNRVRDVQFDKVLFYDYCICNSVCSGVGCGLYLFDVLGFYMGQ